MTECKIFEFVPVGKDHAISTDELAALFGTTRRGVQRKVQAARASGLTICSKTDGAGGYFRPGTAAELEHFVAAMESRRREIEASTIAAREELARMQAAESGQVSLPDVET